MAPYSLATPARRPRRAARRVRRYAPRHLGVVPTRRLSEDEMALLRRVRTGLQALPEAA